MYSTYVDIVGEICIYTRDTDIVGERDMYAAYFTHLPASTKQKNEKEQTPRPVTEETRRRIRKSSQ